MRRKQQAKARLVARERLHRSREKKWTSLSADILQVIYHYLSVQDFLSFRVHRRGMPEPLANTIPYLFLRDPHYRIATPPGVCWCWSCGMEEQRGRFPWNCIPVHYFSLVSSWHTHAPSCYSEKVCLNLARIVSRVYSPIIQLMESASADPPESQPREISIRQEKKNHDRTTRIQMNRTMSIHKHDTRHVSYQR